MWRVSSAQREHRRIRTDPCSNPPDALCTSRGGIGKVILVHLAPNESRRLAAKRIVSEKPRDRTRTLEEPRTEALEPWLLCVLRQRGKPHLPVQPRLKRCDPGRSPRDIADLVAEFVRQPGDAVIRSLHDDFGPLGRHNCEESVLIHGAERSKAVSHLPHGR